MAAHHHNMFTHTQSRGFTLLLSALVSSIVLAMGASIFILVKKQITLSSLGRDSQQAFYAADQAAECALYWDSRWNYFGTSTPASLVDPNDPTCDGQHWSPVGGGGRPIGAPYYPYTMTFQYAPSSGLLNYCANVTVLKTSSGGIVTTVIHSDGFSTSCSTLATNPRSLQRSVELVY